MRRMRLKGKQLEVTASKPPRVGQKVDPLCFHSP
jgi:hypothetical protein